MDIIRNPDYNRTKIAMKTFCDFYLQNGKVIEELMEKNKKLRHNASVKRQESGASEHGMDEAM